MSETKFYICEHCGNIVGKINDAGVPLMCCGQKMKELVPGTVEGNLVKVSVGAVEHPMTEAHLIQWVYLQTVSGGQRKVLTPGAAPAVTFALTDDDKPVAVYAYCNLHGLWMAEI